MSLKDDALAYHRGGRPGKIKVVVIPFGDVWIDSRRRGNSPVEATLSPGEHYVSVGDGTPTQGRAIQVKAGEQRSVVFRRED